MRLFAGRSPKPFGQVFFRAIGRTGGGLLFVMWILLFSQAGGNVLPEPLYIQWMAAFGVADEMQVLASLGRLLAQEPNGNVLADPWKEKKNKSILVLHVGIEEGVVTRVEGRQWLAGEGVVRLNCNTCHLACLARLSINNFPLRTTSPRPFFSPSGLTMVSSAKTVGKWNRFLSDLYSAMMSQRENFYCSK